MQNKFTAWLDRVFRLTPLQKSDGIKRALVANSAVGMTDGGTPNPVIDPAFQRDERAQSKVTGGAIGRTGDDGSPMQYPLEESFAAFKTKAGGADTIATHLDGAMKLPSSTSFPSNSSALSLEERAVDRKPLTPLGVSVDALEYVAPLVGDMPSPSAGSFKKGAGSGIQAPGNPLQRTSAYDRRTLGIKTVDPSPVSVIQTLPTAVPTGSKKIPLPVQPSTVAS